MKKLIITGNAGKDAEQKIDDKGNNFVIFSVGVSVGTKQDPKTDWVEVNCNGKTAELALQYVKKGMKLLAEGYPTVRPYLKDGNAEAVLKLYAYNIEFLSSKQENTAPLHQKQTSFDSCPF